VIDHKSDFTVQIEHNERHILKEDLSYTVLRSKLKSAKVAKQEIAMIVTGVEIKVNQLRSKRQDNSGGKWMLMFGILLIIGALFNRVYLPSYKEATVKGNPYYYFQTCKRKIVVYVLS
jgi:hypothetical protein